MPLRDHFHPPLSELRHWESFHSRWASVIADTLDGDLLPEGYFAEVQVQLGNQIEVDVGTFEHQSARWPASAGGASVTTATATAPPAVWTPPAPDMTMPALFPDRLEVLIFSSEAGPTLVAAIELVSPRNKDRRQSRTAFAAKCATYLHEGIGLVVVDIVTSRHANLHNELIRLLELDEKYCLDPRSLYAITYRPVVEGTAERIDAWHGKLTVGQPLSMLPLPLDKGQCIPLDFDQTYTQACARSRLPEP